MDDHLRISLAVQFELKLPTWQQYGRFLYTSDHVCWGGVNPLDIWRAETGSFLPCLFNRIPNLDRTTDPRPTVQGSALQLEQNLVADSWFFLHGAILGTKGRIRTVVKHFSCIYAECSRAPRR